MRKNSIKIKTLELIKNSNGTSRAELAKKLEITPAGVGKIINKFLESGIIEEISEGISTGGRRPVIIKINKKKIGVILGVSLAPRFIQIVTGDIDGKILKTQKYSLKKRLPEKEHSILELTEKLIEREIKKNSDISTISVVMNGMVDSENGISIFSPHYNWKNINLKRRLEGKFKVKVFVENDVRAMALTEKIFGSCKENQNFVVMNIGDGVGGSIFLNDAPYHGYGSISGELGHMVVRRNSPEKCSCGKKGCLETEVSNVAIIKKITSQIKLNNYSSLKNTLVEKGVLTINDVLKGVAEKDMLTFNIVLEAIHMIANAIDGIISVINPEKIVLFGEIFQNRFLFETLVNEIKKFTLDEQYYEIKRSEFCKNIYEIAPLAVVSYKIFKEMDEE
ncbi:ROK family transcriptional regulator [uncultured Fusobacterium sp.]|jgi:N-acetylglucosamine repressor|uniref:ROK family transcriptional regulator n=1 Tax=uncultured Fusobacterium sp. TaxID=159267 RepID=UPI0025CC8910|nr:ROK family transcriptional regulator [uncultured Fusobacterium sp.]MCF2639076.1 ROK family transcriptional regulator [Fusobacterium varium]